MRGRLDQHAVQAIHPESPFADARPIPLGAHRTRPELLDQIAFAEWINDGRLRQPDFLGLRDDKRPAEVVRERAR
jgi:bifunctional non-homologous end joining protein LigD